MPFPSDEQIMKTAHELVNQLQAIFGKHPGFRPAHAKGILLQGTFTPTAAASKLSIATHFNKVTPITVRLSNSTGIPQIPDADPNASPRGIAIRFNLGGRSHTDIIAHSTPFFPTRTGAEFLAFLQALATSPPGGPSPSPVEQFLGSHPETLAFVQAPKPTPSTYAADTFYGVTAFHLVDAAGKKTSVRYSIVPTISDAPLSAELLATQEPNFLQTELKGRIAAGPVVYKLVVQVAGEGDIDDDNTKHWPASREVVELGTLHLDKVVDKEEGLKDEKYMIFDPIPRLPGVEPSADPLLEMRAAVYLISGKERRAA